MGLNTLDVSLHMTLQIHCNQSPRPGYMYLERGDSTLPAGDKRLQKLQLISQQNIMRLLGQHLAHSQPRLAFHISFVFNRIFGLPYQAVGERRIPGISTRYSLMHPIILSEYDDGVRINPIWRDNFVTELNIFIINHRSHHFVVRSDELEVRLSHFPPQCFARGLSLVVRS